LRNEPAIAGRQRGGTAAELSEGDVFGVKEIIMLILIILLIVIFGGGSGYYGHRRWGFGGGAGVGLGTILLIILLAYLLGIIH
jgi:hypothetical protein